MLLAALYLCYASFGMVHTSLAPLITPIRADLGLSQSAMGFVLGTWMLIFIGTAIPGGALVDRIGTRRALAIGTAMIALSGVARALATDFASLFFAVSLFGIGGPLISIGSPKLIAQVFGDDDRPMVVGIYLTAPGIGTIFALATANSVLMPLFDQSWRLTLAAYGGFAALALLVWLALGRESAASSAGNAKRGSQWSIFAELGASGIVRVILLMAFAIFLFNHALNSWMPEMLRARGFGASGAGFLATVPVIFGTLAGIFITRLATASRRMRILRWGFGAMLVAALLLAFAEGWLLVAGLVLLGLGRMAASVLMLILMESPNVGSRHMGAAGGLFFTAGEVGGVIGPTLMGVLADFFGGFSSGVLMLSAVAGALLALTFNLAHVIGRAPAVAKISA